jgi:hypothetical protein
MRARPPSRSGVPPGTGTKGPRSQDDDRKRALRRERKKRREARAAAGLSCCTVEHDAAMLEFLIATHWLGESDADDPAKVGEAVAAMWRKSAENN